MENFFNEIPTYLQIASLIIAAASAVSMLTKTDSDDKILNALGSIVDALALNFNKAANDPKKNVDK